MSNASTMSHDVRQDDSERNALLNAVASKWKRFSRRKLSALKTTDELIALVVAKYGITTNAARRHVELLLDGRSLTA
jgi:hypothetical protein